MNTKFYISILFLINTSSIFSMEKTEISSFLEPFRIKTMEALSKFNDPFIAIPNSNKDQHQIFPLPLNAFMRAYFKYQDALSYAETYLGLNEEMRKRLEYADVLDYYKILGLNQEMKKRLEYADVRDYYMKRGDFDRAKKLDTAEETRKDLKYADAREYHKKRGDLDRVKKLDTEYAEYTGLEGYKFSRRGTPFATPKAPK